MPVNYKATAALMGGTGVIMGAFGAHALKALLTVSARAATGPTTSFGESIMNDERSSFDSSSLPTSWHVPRTGSSNNRKGS